MAEELDRATVQRCRHGDAAAFRRLVERYQDRVFALCVALAGAADAEDVAQETFVRVYGALGGFDPAGPATLGGWILTIARRLCTDRARYRRRRPTVTLEVVPLAVGATAEADMERAQTTRALRRAIAELPEEQRAVVALRLWDELDYEEIAAVERVPVGTVRSRLARAKDALKRALGVADEERHGTVDAK